MAGTRKRGKTVVAVRLAQLEDDDKLVSRAQAKGILARVDRFKTVVFDFTASRRSGLPSPMRYSESS